MPLFYLLAIYLQIPVERSDGPAGLRTVRVYLALFLWKGSSYADPPISFWQLCDLIKPSRSEELNTKGNCRGKHKFAVCVWGGFY